MLRRCAARRRMLRDLVAALVVPSRSKARTTPRRGVVGGGSAFAIRPAARTRRGSRRLGPLQFRAPQRGRLTTPPRRATTDRLARPEEERKRASERPHEALAQRRPAAGASHLRYHTEPYGGAIPERPARMPKPTQTAFFSHPVSPEGKSSKSGRLEIIASKRRRPPCHVLRTRYGSLRPLPARPKRKKDPRRHRAGARARPH